MRVLVVANLTPIKGIDLLLKALQDLKKPWTLKVVGKPFATHQKYAQSLFDCADQLVANDASREVAFLGWQSKEQVRDLLAGCNIFVLPSRSEACPLALLEAMALGCFCIAADVGDVAAMLADYDKSRVFESESSAELLKCLQSYCQDSKETVNKKSTSFPEIYSMSALANSYEQIYQQMNRKNKL